jgi:hypothetical protein
MIVANDESRSQVIELAKKEVIGLFIYFFWGGRIINKLHTNYYDYKIGYTSVD